MADRDDLTDSFLALVDEAFFRLLNEPEAMGHVREFAEGDVAFVLIRDGLEVRRWADVYGSENDFYRGARWPRCCGCGWAR